MMDPRPYSNKIREVFIHEGFKSPSLEKFDGRGDLSRRLHQDTDGHNRRAWLSEVQVIV